MNILTLQNVEKSYGTRLLFKEVNLSITSDSRIGLIGVNGTGKSTFLKVLAEQMDIDKGHIERNGKASVYMLPQNPNFNEEDTVWETIFLGGHPTLELVRRMEKASANPDSKEYLQLLETMDREGAWHVEQQAKVILNKLGFQDTSIPVKQLSGGQRRRLALAQALLFPCDLLLLDEPTNHLDEASIAWLEKFLKERTGGFILSTHDRYFLDAVCESILELSNKRFYEFKERYEQYVERKDLREAQLDAIEEKRQKLIKSELKWVRRGAKARTTKQKARLQRFEQLKAMESRQRADTLDPIALESRLGKTIFDMENLGFSYEDGQPIIRDFTYHVVKHDRIGIVGPNGIGKSTLMQLLDGALEPTSGTVGRGETVRIAHFSQQLPQFKENQRVLDYIREDRNYLRLNDGSTLSAGQLLERFLFAPEQHGVFIHKLSGGEKRRLYLLKLLMSSPNVLLLDEPTNDLDIPTLEVLEDFLDTFGGVVITVCHDRYFLDRVVDKLFLFTGDGRVELFHGSYSDYEEEQVEHQNIESGATSNKASTKETSPSMANEDPVVEGKKKLTMKEEKEYEEIEGRIAELEGLMKAYDAMMGQFGSDYSEMEATVQAKLEAERELEALTERWLELEEKKGDSH